MSHKALASFSTSGHYYAHISGDGKLRIWDVTTCILKQEFTPDFHLTSPYTELCWISSSKSINLLSGSRKRKSSNAMLDTENEHILLGSRSGDIFLYSVSSYSIVNTFKNGHNSCIRSISWCRNIPHQFFSCSEDQFIVQWNLDNTSVKKKWKCGKVSCIVVSDDGMSLISAKKEIKWWDLSKEKEIVLKTFIGHSTDIYSLTFVQICGEVCVLSASFGNRLIHAWLLNNEIEDRSALVTFALDDALISISVLNTLTGGINILSSSKTGVLHVYECIINGKKHVKPIKPKLSIQIAADSNNEKEQLEQIPIVSSAYCDENNAYIAYGADAILSFEIISLNSSEKSMFIVRQDPRKRVIANKEQLLNKILPTSSKNTLYMQADSVNGFYTNINKKTVKRGINEKSIDVPLEERLENLIVNVPSTSTAPTSDSLVHLMLQGLKSKDSRILQDVLVNKDESIIKTTVSRLPVEAIWPLGTELISMLQGKRNLESSSAVKWLRYILIIHAAHLISNPDVAEVFSPIFPIIESKLNTIGPLYKLVGRLDLMIQQIKYRTEESERMLKNANLQPKLIYQDEDSDEESDNEIVQEDNIVSNEESDDDDHWDEMSEIDDSGPEHSPDGDMDTVDL